MSDNLDLFGSDAGEQKHDVATIPAPLVEYAEIDNCSNLSALMPWESPQPLFATIEPIPYPIESLPPIMRDAVQEVGDFVQAPVPMVALSAMAALSIAAQGHVDVQRASRLEGPCSLFMLAIADSGERKSTCDGFFSQPIKEYEKQQAIAAKPEIKKYEAELGAWEAKKSGIKERIKGATKAKRHEEAEAARIELIRLEDERPEPPRVPRLTYADATPEALIDGLATKWPSGGVVSSEAGAVLGSHGMGGDSVTRNLATLNQCWDGFTPRIDRKTSASIEAKRVRLTMALLVQEPTIMAFIEKTGGLARGTGFFARFLLAWPDSTQGARLFRETPENWPALDRFNARIAQIINHSLNITENGDLEPTLLALTPEAKAHWVEYHDEVEVELGNGGTLYAIRDIASKSADNAARIAALFHVLDGGTGAIGLDAMERACKVAQWHLSESLRFFGEISAPAGLTDAARLDAWLIERCRNSGAAMIAKSDALQNGPNAIRKVERMTDAISELIQLGRLRMVTVGKRIMLEPHPDLVANPANAANAANAIVRNQASQKTTVSDSLTAANVANPANADPKTQGKTGNFSNFSNFSR